MHLTLPLTFIIIFTPAQSFSQDIDARSPKPNSGSPQQKKADKKKAALKKKNEKAIEKGKTRHNKIQAKKTRKMMKRSKHKSEMWNSNKREPFYKRWFSKKQR